MFKKLKIYEKSIIVEKKMKILLQQQKKNTQEL